MDIESHFTFKGEASRQQYWATIAIVFVVIIIAGISMQYSSELAILIVVAAFASFWAMFAVTAKRCRDIGINPWWTLTILIPYINVIIGILFGCMKTKGIEKTRNFSQNGTSSNAQELISLKALLDQEVLTQEQFDEKKKELGF